jgi:hypothetical protein
MEINQAGWMSGVAAKKKNQGRSTQYLMLIADEHRLQLTIDQVFALYLVDVCDLC